MRILTIFLAFLLLPSIAIATVFTPPFTDKSVQLLGVIFGAHIGPIFLGGAANPALMHMFEMLNAVIFTIGSVIITYIGVVSTINTAQEGKALGKKFGSIWIPMRAVLGMLTLVPTPTTGYSVVQIGVMWLIMQGIGAADQVWNSVLRDLSYGLSSNTAIVTPVNNVGYRTLRTQGVNLTADVLRSSVCMVTLNDISNNVSRRWRPSDVKSSSHNIYGKNFKWHEIINDIQATDNEATIKGSVHVGVPGNDEFHDICGRYDIVATVNRADFGNNWSGSINELKLKAQEVYNSKLLALSSMSHDLKIVAEEIAAERAEPRGLNNRLVASNDISKPMQPAGGRDRAINIYTQEVGSLVIPHYQHELKDIVRDGRQSGWIAAGSFYFALNHVNEHVNYFPSVLQDPPTADPNLLPTCTDQAECSEYLNDDSNLFNYKLRSYLNYHDQKSYLATRLWDAEIYLANDKAKVSDQINIHLPRAEEERFVPHNRENFQRYQELQRESRVLLMKAMTGRHHDPLISQGKFGTDLMVASEQWLLKLIVEQQVRVNNAAQNNDLLTPAMRELINNANYIGVLSLGVFAIVWSMGAMLAIYVPLIPYMMFTVAVVGWFLLVVEAIVAAPIFALSFILPSGEELGKVMNGLMLLLNILLRPTLMLFGFILASRLYRAVIQLINFSILGNFENLDSSSSLFAWLAILALYGGFIIALANKCFSLIYALPDKILRWMGGGPEHTDATQELNHAKGVFGKGTDSVEKISTGAAEREFSRLQSHSAKFNAPANAPANPPADAVRGGRDNNSN